MKKIVIFNNGITTNMEQIYKEMENIYSNTFLKNNEYFNSSGEYFAQYCNVKFIRKVIARGLRASPEKEVIEDFITVMFRDRCKFEVKEEVCKDGEL